MPSGTVDLYVAILGVLRAGAAYVPVDADDPPERAERIWRGANVAAVVEEGLALRVITAGAGPGGLTPNSDAWVIFTSGSTGEPKGVAVTHRSAAAFVDAEARLWDVEPSDRVLAGLSVAFDASCEEIWLAWRNGATLVPAPRALVRSGAEFGPWLAENGITVVSTVPTLAAMWDEKDLAGVRLLILGGEACPERLAWRLARGREVWNTYGPTEATVVSTAARLHPEEPVTIGWPLAGWRVAVVDDEGSAVPLGEPGELAIAGIGLGRYLDAGLDEKRFAPLAALDWERSYRTGDVVRETVNGLEFVGRHDDQVKLGGRRLELGEIDAHLRSAPGVQAAAAAVHETAAGNPVLVGYVVGDADPADVRAHVAKRLADGVTPLIVGLDALPLGSSGKVDRRALPWPPPAVNGAGANGNGRAPTDPGAGSTELPETEAWLAACWTDQLGPLRIDTESDFFELGGTSMAAAKLASALRARFPTVAIADVYENRRLGSLAARLDALGKGGAGSAAAPSATPRRRRRGAVHLAGFGLIEAIRSLQVTVGVFAFNYGFRLTSGARILPRAGLGWLLGGWLVFGSAPGRAAIVAVVRRLALRDLKPGRYPRHSGLAYRLWLVDRMTQLFRLDSLSGTPWAARYARICGAKVGRDVSLKTLPSPTGLISIGPGAVIEEQVDLHGWWIEGDEVVVGEIRIGAGARIGARSVLMPGADVGIGAEVEPGSVICGAIPARERWSGSPARLAGGAGEAWPAEPAPEPAAPRFWRGMYAVGLLVFALLPVLAGLPVVVLFAVLNGHGFTLAHLVWTMVVFAPLAAVAFIVSYAVIAALFFRAASLLLRPGWHSDQGGTAWALWFTGGVLQSANSALFPVFLSLYLRPWLRLLGLNVGRRTEMSHSSDLNKLTSMGDMAFAADDASYAVGRVRQGWLHVAPIEIGSRSFVGNSAVLVGDTKLGADNMLGALTTAPKSTADGTSWFGCPALELPRVAEASDPARTTDPSRRVVIARAAVEFVRIVWPTAASVALAALVFGGLDAVGNAAGLGAMIAAAPVLFLLGGIAATLLTIATKWLAIGRYRPGKHPFWSFFVWRDEIINSCQEMLAGPWLIGAALGTPLMPLYLRAMGARVGRDVWFETLAVTEHDLVEIGDGAVVNRDVLIDTHLFHDRLFQLGPASIGAGATIGPRSAVLPHTTLGDGCSIGGRSVVMRGEQVPAGTRWHGSPLVAI